MKLIIKLFGVLALVAGISLLINPEIIIGWLKGNIESTSLYISAIVARLFFGILFVVAARESIYPVAIRLLGYLLIIAAVIFIINGHESFQDLMSSLLSDAKPFAPVGGLLSVAFGGFVLYAFSRKKELEHK